MDYDSKVKEAHIQMALGREDLYDEIMDGLDIIWYASPLGDDDPYFQSKETFVDWYHDALKEQSYALPGSDEHVKWGKVAKYFWEHLDESERLQAIGG